MLTGFEDLTLSKFGVAGTDCSLYLIFLVGEFSNSSNAVEILNDGLDRKSVV